MERDLCWVSNIAVAYNSDYKFQGRVAPWGICEAIVKPNDA